MSRTLVGVTHVSAMKKFLNLHVCFLFYNVFSPNQMSYIMIHLVAGLLGSKFRTFLRIFTKKMNGEIYFWSEIRF